MYPVNQSSLNPADGLNTYSINRGPTQIADVSNAQAMQNHVKQPVCNAYDSTLPPRTAEEQVTTQRSFHHTQDVRRRLTDDVPSAPQQSEQAQHFLSSKHQELERTVVDITAGIRTLLRFGSVEPGTDGLPVVRDVSRTFNGLPIELSEISTLSQLIAAQEKYFLLTYAQHRLTVRDVVGYAILSYVPETRKYQVSQLCQKAEQWTQAVQVLTQIYHAQNACGQETTCTLCRFHPMVAILFNHAHFFNVLRSKNIDPVLTGLAPLDLPNHALISSLARTSPNDIGHYRRTCQLAKEARTRLGFHAFDHINNITPFTQSTAPPQQGPAIGMRRLARNAAHLDTTTPLPGTANSSRTRHSQSTDNHENLNHVVSKDSHFAFDPTANVSRTKRKSAELLSTARSQSTNMSTNDPVGLTDVRGPKGKRLCVPEAERTKSKDEARRFARAAEKPAGATKAEDDKCLTCLDMGRGCGGTSLVSVKGDLRCQSCVKTDPDGSGSRKCYWKDASRGIYTLTQAKAADPNGRINAANSGAGRRVRALKILAKQQASQAGSEQSDDDSTEIEDASDSLNEPAGQDTCDPDDVTSPGDALDTTTSDLDDATIPDNSLTTTNDLALTGTQFNIDDHIDYLWDTLLAKDDSAHLDPALKDS